MTENWKIFEDNACKFLNQMIRIEGINFKQGGKSNAWDSDIHAEHLGNELFLIEAKLSPSQCGQFVILLKNGKYEYSKLNQHSEDQISKEIINHINQHINRYQNCGTAGLKINLPKKIFADWIKSHYSKKSAKFIITSDKPDNFSSNFIRVIPLGELGDNFEISAVLRRKRSGTQHMPEKDFLKVQNELANKFGRNNFSLSEDGKAVIKNCFKKEFYLGGNYYLVRQNGVYIVKKRSKVNNPSVIFSLVYNGEKKTAGLDLLEQEIKNLI